MTEDEWVQADDTMIDGAVQMLGPRKARLFASAVCRVMGGREFHPVAVAALEVNDRFADDEVPRRALWEAERKVRAVRDELGEHTSDVEGRHYSARYMALLAVEYVCTDLGPFMASMYPASTHQLMSNLREEETRRQLYPAYRDLAGIPFRPIIVKPSWRTSTAVGLARAMYESRDFTAMPILAGALEDAGCDSADVLAHCRGDGPHVRGCWVVDLVLGKN